MEKKWIIRILLLIAYCVPYAFLSINGDANYGTMMFYGVMVVAFFLLCLVSIKTKNIAVIFIGNIFARVITGDFQVFFREFRANMKWNITFSFRKSVFFMRRYCYLYTLHLLYFTTFSLESIIS